MTQRALADAVGVSVQAVSQWENNTTVPGYARLNMVANLLNVDVRWLLGELAERRALFEVSAEIKSNIVPLIPIVDALRFGPFVANTARKQIKYPGQITTRKLAGQGFAVVNSDPGLTPLVYCGDIMVFDNAADFGVNDWVIAFIGDGEQLGSNVFVRQLVSMEEHDDTPFPVLHFQVPGSDVPDITLGATAKSIGFIIAPMVELIRGQAVLSSET